MPSLGTLFRLLQPGDIRDHEIETGSCRGRARTRRGAADDSHRPARSTSRVKPRHLRCKTNKKDRFAFCNKTPRTDFQNGACYRPLAGGFGDGRDWGMGLAGCFKRAKYDLVGNGGTNALLLPARRLGSRSLYWQLDRPHQTR